MRRRRGAMAGLISALVLDVLLVAVVGGVLWLAADVARPFSGWW